MKILSFGLVLISIIIFMFIIKNIEILKKIFENLRKKINVSIIKIKLIFISIVILSIIVLLTIISLKNNYTYYCKSIENSKSFEITDNKIDEEINYYKNIISNDFDIEKAMKPYIPEGFEYLEGSWNAGYVITDVNGNEFVWVPVLNKETDDIVKLSKIDFRSGENYISSANTYDENYKEFFDSVLKYSGFYVSRYELGKESESIVSKKNMDILRYSSKENLLNDISSIYDSQNFKCQLINGYAYDSMISWINKSNNIIYDKYDVSKNILTGRKSYNNIYDIFDNVLEVTDEILYETYIMRGCLNDSNDYLSRYNIYSNLTLEFKEDIISSRVILFNN